MLSSLANLTVGLATSSVALAFYLHNYQPLLISNPILKSAFSYLQSINDRSKADKFSYNLLYFLVRWELITNQRRQASEENQWIIDLSEKIMSSGFDVEGISLKGIDKIGMKGIEIGPKSLKQAPDSSHLGLLYTKSNILTFRQQNPNSKLLIGINLTADKQVVEYVPYIIPNNLTNSVQDILTINKQQQKINFITMDTNSIDQLIQKEVEGSQQLWDQLISSTTSKCKKAGIPIFYHSKDKNFFEIEVHETKKKKQLILKRKQSRLNEEMIDWKQVIKLILEC